MNMNKPLCKKIKDNVKNSIKCFNTAKVSNRYFDNCKDQTGVYIFFNELTPVYIGESGSSKQDLKTRINQHYQLNNSGATLMKNICKIDKCEKPVALEKIKNYNVKVIICGPVNHKNSEVSKSLETSLIGLFKPKYNEWKFPH